MIATESPVANTATLTTVPRTCQHFALLERWLANSGHGVGPEMPSPYGEEFGTECHTTATLSASHLRDLLRCDPCLQVVEYRRPYCDVGDVTVYCRACHRSIVGPLPTMCG